jgi:SAM-dependent methyltransferase
MLKLAIGGNYSAPLDQPSAILDVACGTGVWCRELAEEFPQARVVGVDIDRTPMQASLAQLGPNARIPANFHFLTADALKPFPFADGEFAYAHARMVSPFIPIKSWPHVLGEMTLVVRKGGIVEIMDHNLGTSSSLAFHRLMDGFRRLSGMGGLHAGVGDHLPGYFREAGLQQVQQRLVLVGEGAQSAKLAEMLRVDLQAALTNMQPIMLRAGIFTEEQYQQTLKQMEAEVAEVGVIWPFFFVYGVKP